MESFFPNHWFCRMYSPFCDILCQGLYFLIRISLTYSLTEWFHVILVFGFHLRFKACACFITLVTYFLIRKFSFYHQAIFQWMPLICRFFWWFLQVQLMYIHSFIDPMPHGAQNSSSESDFLPKLLLLLAASCCLHLFQNWTSPR